MDALDILKDKLAVARRELDELLARYTGMEDTQRMEMSNTVLDEVHSYLGIKENLLLPYVEQATGREPQELMMRVCPTHYDIEYIVEHLIQIHVDEPGFEYYNRLVQLQAGLAQAARDDEEALLPWLRANLKEVDRQLIAGGIKAELSHESSPRRM